MKTLIIAEKPSVARTIATFLNATKSIKGALQNNEYTVSWAIGHLVELASPKSYVENPWNLNSLPIIPNEFSLSVKPKTKDQFYILKKLIASHHTIINAADAAREGELIFRNIMELTNSEGKSIKRLWVNSYTDKDLQKAFDNIQEQSVYDNLHLAAKARSQLDWLYGMNSTIGFTLAIASPKVKSLGRVQTPTYCMVAKRYLENQNFVSEQTYTPTITVSKNDISFKAKFEPFTLIESEANVNLGNTNTFATATKARIQKSAVQPPKLHELQSLQTEANKRFGYTAQNTLNYAQSLYEKHQLITYPRTDSSYLNESQKGEIKELLNTLKESVPNKSKYLLDRLREVSFNNNKVTDHHAIIPTGKAPSSLTEQELTIFNLVIDRTLQHFSKDAIKSTLHYVFNSNDVLYHTRETVFTELQWKAIGGSDQTQEVSIPEVRENETLPIIEKEILKGSTKPPPLLTDASLLALMQNCGKDFEGEMDNDIKKDGIGTRATRAATIERIIKVGYIKRQKKYIIPTEMGLFLYPTINSFKISSVTLTGRIENGLHKIEEGSLSFDEFMKAIKTNTLISCMSEILKTKPQLASNKLFQCPKCNQNNVKHYVSTITCEDCSLSLPTTYLGNTFSEEQLTNITNGKEIEVEGLKSKKSKNTFSALISYNKEKDFYSLRFPEKKTVDAKPTTYKCPKCNNHLNDLGTFYGCSNFLKGCKTSIPKIFCRYTFSEDNISDLLNGKVLNNLELYSEKKSKNFTGNLTFNKGKLELSF